MVDGHLGKNENLGAGRQLSSFVYKATKNWLNGD